MRILKGFLFVLVSLFIVVTLLSLLIPSKVMTVRAVVIQSSNEKIFTQVSDLKNWKNWHPVFKTNPTITYSNPSAGLNAYAEWVTKGKKNRLTITEITSEYVKLILSRPGEKDVENIIGTLPVQNTTGQQVEWRALVTLKWYPWEKFAGIFLDKITGPGYEDALNGLKEFLDKQP